MLQSNYDMIILVSRVEQVLTCLGLWQCPVEQELTCWGLWQCRVEQVLTC